MAQNDAAESRSNYSSKNKGQPDILRSIDTDQNN